MKGFFRKVGAFFMAVPVFAALFGGSALLCYAASAQLTFSDPAVTVGNEVNVTMKIATSDGTLGRSDVMLKYDTERLEFMGGTGANGGAGQVRVTGSMDNTSQTTFTFSLRFKAIRAGDTSIEVVSEEVYDADDQMVTLSHVGSSAIKVEASSSASNDAGLSSLSISPGTLTPAFSSDITEYTATVYGDTASITVSAPARDESAKVAVSGNESLQPGENTVECTVTAEDGTVRVYTIKVTKVEGEAPENNGDASIAVDEGNWEVADTFDESLLPEGFIPGEYEYDGRNVMAGIDDNGHVLLYLTDENGEGDFFFYDTKTNTLSQYVTVMMAEKTVVVLPPELIPEDVALPDGFVNCTINIGEHTVHGWIWNDDSESPEYCVVYGMNSDGERNFYRYDQKEMTLQRYFADPDAESLREDYLSLVDEYNSLLDDYNKRGTAVACLIAACVILAIITAALVIMRIVGNHKAPYDRARERHSATERETGPRAGRDRGDGGYGQGTAAKDHDGGRGRGTDARDYDGGGHGKGAGAGDYDGGHGKGAGAGQYDGRDGGDASVSSYDADGASKANPGLEDRGIGDLSPVPRKDSDDFDDDFEIIDL